MSYLLTKGGQFVTKGGALLCEKLFTRPVVDLTSVVSQAQTTGSISASSNTLPVADATGFPVGTALIVETGGEAGAGARGTVGVGGSWPTLTYANAAAMNADTSKPNGRLCGLLDTGNVYEYNSTTTTWNQIVNFYYADKIVPQALQATVTNRVGNVLTLSVSATVTATNANVYFNNVPPINAAITAGGAAKNYQLPSGNFAGAGAIAFTQLNSCAFSGQGKASTRLFNPRGAGSLSIEGFQSHSLERYGFHLEGNARLTGYSFDRRYMTDSLPLQTQPAILSTQGNRTYDHDFKLTDTWYNGLRQALNCVAEDIEIVLTEGQGDYVQWQWDIANSFYCVGRRITITSPYLVGGFECFGSTECGFESCTGTNAARAWNSATNCYFLAHTTTVTPMSQNPVGDNWNNSNPMFSINSNISPGVGGGGSIINDTTTIQGVINALNVIPKGIQGISTARGVTITGGSYSAPNFVDGTYSPVGIDGADDWIVDGFTSTGVVPSYSANINLTPGSTSVIRNSTAAIMRASTNGGGNTFTTFKTV